MKKLQTRVAYSIMAAWILTFIISLFPSCEIGLGGAVDTQAPSLTIDSPKVDSVIRDVFAISGRWSDDGTIDSLNVTLKRTDGKGTEAKIAGEWVKDDQLKETGTWRAIIDYKEASLSDGTYQATVSIKDKGHHETTQSTTFTIDNTAPVLVLSRPSIKDGQNGFDNYGRTFTLEGKAADDNDVSLIEVKIFENADSTEPLKVVELKNVPLTIEQDVAVYEADKENDYSVIYGDTEFGKAAQRYCTVTIYDGAQRYPQDGSEQTEEDKKGNSINTYYMNSEMTSLLQGSVKITDLYHMMNGSYEADEARSASTDNIISQLESYKVSKSKFSINPANNPKYIVSSGNVLEANKDLDDVDYQLTAGNRYIEIEITPGLDGYPIDPDTVGVYLQKCDENGNILDEEKIWLINTGAEYHKTQEEIDAAEAAGLTLDNKVGVYSISGSTYKFKTSKLIHKDNYGVAVGNYYMIMVDGNDSQGAGSGKIISDGKYGFKFVSNEEKIELSVQGVPDYLSKKAAAWAVEGHKKFTVTLSWATTMEGPFEVYRLDKNGQDYVKLENLTAGPALTEGVWHASEEFDYASLKALAPAEKDFPEKLAYVLKKENSEDIISTTARINLKYDSDEPSISNIQFTNSYVKENVTQDENGNDIIISYTYYVKNDGSNKSNITGIATDDTGIEKVELVVPGFANAFNSTESRFKFNNVDFSSLTAANITAQIIATDVAGNQTAEDLDIVFDKTPPHGVHAIDASSKNLYLRVGNTDNDDIDSENDLWDDDLDKGVGGKYGNGTFGNATTIQIRGNFSDDFDDGEAGSGVAMIYYKIYDQEKKHLTEEQETALMNEVLTEPTGYFAPIEPVTKRVFYNVGQKLDANNEPILDGEGKPQSDESQVFEDSTQFTFAPNSKGFFKYYKNVESNFNANLTGFKEGNNYLVLVVKDNVGNTAIDAVTVNFNGVETRFVNYTLNVDTTPPSDITTKSHSGIIYTNGTNVPLLWGTVSDKSSTANASAGIRSFVLTRDGVNTKVTASLTPLDNQDSTLKKWEVSAQDLATLLPVVTNGSQTVSISATATDDAGVGNTTPAVVATITVDTKLPTVIIDSASPSDADTDTEGIQVNGTIALAGTSDDANGISELVGLYYKTYTDSVPATPDSSTISGWTQVSASESGTVNWKFTGINTASLDSTNSIADGTKVCLSVAVKDNAGNIGYSVPKQIVVDQDTDRPVIHLSTLPLTYKVKDVNDVEQTYRMDSDHPVWFNRSELSGTIDDDDGAVSYVKVIAVDPLDSTISDPPSDSNWESASNVYKNGIWSYTIPSNGYKKIYFQIKDSAGNTFTSNTQSTTSTTYGPKIQDTEAKLFGYNTQGSSADDVIYVKVDTDDPVLEVMKYYTCSVLVDDPAAIQDYNPYTQAPGWKIAESSIIPDKFGGTNRYLYIKCKTYDTNGISSIALKFGDISPLEGNTVEIPQQAGDENYKEIITCFNIKQDMTPVPSGLTKLEINIKDNAAANTGSNGISKYYEAMVDNDEPEINFSNYTKGSQVYGSSAVTLRGTTSDSSKVEKVEYALSKTDAAVPVAGWVEITDETKPTYTSKLGWQIVFDGKTPENDNTFTDPSSYHAALLKESLFSLYAEEIGQEDPATYDTTQKIYIWMRATDELGNMGTNTEGFFLDVIPNGDRPAIEITYPADSSSVGGTIRITGTTEIQDTSASVKNVYLQIDPSYDKNAGFNASWAEELQLLLTPAVGSAVTSYSITDLTGVTVNGTDLGTKIGSGIASQGNSKMNWYLTINGNKEYNGKVNNDNRTIGIRAVAVSSTGKVSFSEVHACTIDPDAPIFGQTNELRFVQLDQNGNETASRKFENGVYLKGQWYLVGSVEDDSGLREIKLGTQSIVYSTGDEGAEVVTNASNGMIIENNNILVNEGSRFKNYDLKIPVGNSEAGEFGKLDYEISVTDGSASQIENTLKFTIFYDNKAPGFEAQKGNEILLETNGKIFQSNGSYTVKGTFAEPSEGTNNQSGFNRIAMFFTRKRVEDGNTNLYLIDPMIAGGEDQEDNFVKLGKLGNDGKVANFEENISFKDGLYWRQVTASLESTNELTVASGSLVEGALPSNIRAGGLCMINNVIYRIKSISGTKLILEGSISDFDGKPVYFAFAQIIDNQSQESGTVGLYAQNDPTTNPDGDCMVEGVVFGAGIYNWNASINSSNMLDGNATMSFVAYDAAGNYTEQSFEQKISNNAPRIAGVIFGTDTNLDGDITGNEINEFYSGVFTHEANPSLNGYDNLGNRISSYTIPERLTVKGDVMLKPMIVGGNKALGQQYSFSTTTQAGTYNSTPTQYAGVEHSSSNNVRTDDLTINISLTDFITNNVKEGEQDITFTIWDKTDGSNLGDEESGSAKADIKLPVNVVISDNEYPTIEIAPFYWKSQTDNSLYQNNVKNGHIELIGELPQGNDGDAMVSGKITFDGIATDNVIVQKIKVGITGYNGGTPFVIAERDKTASTTDGWKSTSLYYEKNGEAVTGAANTLDNKDWVFELISDTYGTDGRNTVEFKFHFNTEKHPDVAKENVTFAFTVEDKGSPSSTGVYANAKSSTADPTVDIVPYITKVYTALAKLKNNNWSVYNRTALGHYPVASNETIYIYGFNLGNESVTPEYKFGNGAGDVVLLAAPVNAGITNFGTEQDPITPSYPCGSEYASYSVVAFNVSNVPASGEITIQVNGVPIQNNSNNTDAKGQYTGTTTSATGDKSVYDNYYNRQPNGDNNNLLTDDVILDVWEIDPQAVKPVNGYATQPVMAINPVTHDVGFAFVNGTLYYSMPNGNKGEDTHSYDVYIGGYDFWTSVGLTYDSLGYAYGTAAGGDIADNRADTFRIMTSRWGYADRDVNGYNNGYNQYRLEYVAQADYDENGVLTRNFNKERVRSPSLTTTTASDEGTKLYMAYYDEINDEIRFKYGVFTNTWQMDWYTNRNTDSQKNTFFGDYYGENKSGNTVVSASESNGKSKLEEKNGQYRLAHNSLIAGQTTDKYTKNDKKTKVTTAVTTTEGDPVYAGKYVSIAAIENGGTDGDDAVVVVWWDAENSQLLYSFNKTPSSINVGEFSQSDTGWSTPVAIFGEANGIGEYCKVVVDKGNHVHIAAYDSLNGDVWYAYIPDFAVPGTRGTCIVDSYGIIGTELNIDVGMDSSNNPIPYISYYAGSCAKPKTAHWANKTPLTVDSLAKGAVDEAFTGKWEVSVIPTASKVSIDHINIGLWKDSSTGEIIASTEGETALLHLESYTGNGNGYKSWGNVWGNGTANAILGYAVTKGSKGYIETAQMR